MKPGYWPDIARMQRTIKEAGYTPMPERTSLVVTGKVVREGDRLAIALDQMRAPVTLPIRPAQENPETAPHLERHLGQTVKVEGSWQSPPAGQSGFGTLAVSAVHSAGPPRADK